MEEKEAVDVLFRLDYLEPEKKSKYMVLCYQVQPLLMKRMIARWKKVDLVVERKDEGGMAHPAERRYLAHAPAGTFDAFVGKEVGDFIDRLLQLSLPT